MNKERLNCCCKARYEKPKVKIVKPILSNPFTTTYTVSAYHKK